MASKCSTVLDDPPNAIITAIAFSNAFLVSTSRAVIPLANMLTTPSRPYVHHNHDDDLPMAGQPNPAETYPRPPPLMPWSWPCTYHRRHLRPGRSHVQWRPNLLMTWSRGHKRQPLRKHHSV